MINSGEVIVEDALLEGHLGITRELLAFQSPEKKYNIGSEKGGSNLIRVWNKFSSIDFFMVQIPHVLIKICSLWDAANFLWNSKLILNHFVMYVEMQLQMRNYKCNCAVNLWKLIEIE